jgi:hypothetical protein
MNETAALDGPAIVERLLQGVEDEAWVSTLLGLRNTEDYTEKRECPLACTNECF